ncbi:hypothetical protein GW17_00014617 [Ensete ventricosum]|nr:hypothetical protein GW17_00014617 [Ensete ventricosum]
MGSRSPQSDRACPTSFSSPYDRSSPPNLHTFNPLGRLFPTTRVVPRRSRLQPPFKPNPSRIDSAVDNSHEKKKGLPDLLLMKASALSWHWNVDGWITSLHRTRCYVSSVPHPVALCWIHYLLLSTERRLNKEEVLPHLPPLRFALCPSGPQQTVPMPVAYADPIIGAANVTTALFLDAAVSATAVVFLRATTIESADRG